ncbi:HD domain-containing protein [Bacteroidales bacterium OttesenSCG-928-I14]|nr:HD domain-containing protein [Bacteroidales bacterium OttesenSCG-928-I14]
MDPIEILKKYYNDDSELYKILFEHSLSVANKALAIADMHSEMIINKAFIYEASMLHDIGIIYTDAPKVHCYGDSPYICHGYLGSEMLRKEGYELHALVCERHTGSGITKEEIIKRELPIPARDMLPVSLEEKLICFADKFFSKTKLDKEKPIEKVRKGIAKHGEDSLSRFDEMLRLFLGS